MIPWQTGPPAAAAARSGPARSTWLRISCGSSAGAARGSAWGPGQTEGGGLRTTRADEMWHIDTTVIRLLDWTRAYLHAVIDNFSRWILAWRVAETFAPVNSVAVLLDASRGATPSDDDYGRVGGRGRRERECPGSDSQHRPCLRTRRGQRNQGPGHGAGRRRHDIPFHLDLPIRYTTAHSHLHRARRFRCAEELPLLASPSRSC